MPILRHISQPASQPWSKYSIYFHNQNLHFDTIFIHSLPPYCTLCYFIFQDLYLQIFFQSCMGRAMTQAVINQHLTTDAWVESQASPCGICGGQNDIETGFSPDTSVVPCQILCTTESNSFIHLSLTLCTLSNWHHHSITHLIKEVFLCFSSVFSGSTQTQVCC